MFSFGQSQKDKDVIKQLQTSLTLDPICLNNTLTSPKHSFAVAVQSWLDTLDSDITEINFINVPYGVVNAISAVTPEELVDFCFDLTRFTKISTVICQHRYLHLSSGVMLIGHQCPVVLNLQFSPLAPVKIYHNQYLLLNVQFLQLDSPRFKNIPNFELEVVKHIRNTINNIPKSVTCMTVHSLWVGARCSIISL
jgi:hypothetical protein